MTSKTYPKRKSEYANKIEGVKRAYSCFNQEGLLDRELHNSSSDEPIKMSVENLMTIQQQTSMDDFVGCLVAGRWILNTDGPGEVVYSHKLFKELLKEVSAITNKDLRTSLFEKLMKYKNIK